MTENMQNRSKLMKKLSKGLIVSTPLVVAAFSMSPVANAQLNCPAGSTYSGGICLATSTYRLSLKRAPRPKLRQHQLTQPIRLNLKPLAKPRALAKQKRLAYQRQLAKQKPQALRWVQGRLTIKSKALQKALPKPQALLVQGQLTTKPKVLPKAQQKPKAGKFKRL